MTFFPIFDHIEKPRTVVGVVAAAVYWRDFMTNVLPEHAQPVFVLLENGCGQTFSFRVVGENVEVLGEDDLHERRFDHLQCDCPSVAFFAHLDLDLGPDYPTTFLSFIQQLLDLWVHQLSPTTNHLSP
jgi:hypothetical protein